MTRNPRRTILATFHAMLFVQTIGSIDDRHKLPAPKQYAAHGIVWGILFFMADTGLGKLAARLSLLILLTAMVIGPFGPRFVSFLQGVAARFAPPSESAPPGGAQDAGPIQQPFPLA